ncbi:dead-box ATP-dependent RNA helicase 21 [Phtheirospermum japonicum]|uniref:Protein DETOXIFICATION n=1 Tax=Phtheirospermum japonicum TaxID=374723 RepID=A0A830BSL2_9LAMI|nr:dead-box ATP-dependent RNA helicase 21 [Phtheirospermum japonicum]
MLTYITRLPPISEENEAEGPYAVVMAPTRELAQQIEEETVKFAHYMGIKVVSIVGGQSIEEQGFKIRQGCEVVIATPGRLLDCLERRYVVLNQCNYIVLDEADRMIDMGFEPQVVGVLDAMPSSNMKPENEDEELDEKRIYRTTYMFRKATELITQHVLMLRENDKIDRLKKLLDELGDKTAIVFVNTKKVADYVAKTLDKEDGRGIDIPDVAHVINHDMPNNIEAYTHRIGRTGRAGKTGVATTFLTLHDTEVFYDLKQMLTQSNSPSGYWSDHVLCWDEIFISHFRSAMCNLISALTFVLAWILRIEKVNLKTVRSHAKIMGTLVTVGNTTTLAPNKFFAIGNTTTLYGMVQCTRDISADADDCRGCVLTLLVRIANELRRGDAKATKFSIKVLITTSVVIGVFFTIIFLVFGHNIGYLFMNDVEVAKTVSELSLLLAISVLLNCIYPVLLGYFDIMDGQSENHPLSPNLEKLHFDISLLTSSSPTPVSSPDMLIPLDVDVSPLGLDDGINVNENAALGLSATTGKLKAQIWAVYHQLVKIGGKWKAKCKHCPTFMLGDPSQGSIMQDVVVRK